MKAFGIIAAGEGSRLAAARPGVPKPLVEVAGRPLAHWVVGGLRAAGFGGGTVLVNSRGAAVPGSLSAAFPDLELDFVSRDTASSFESFRLVARRLAERHDAFLISTVDALVPPAEIAAFWSDCRASGAEAGLAITRFVDDEKPLWVSLAGGKATAIGGQGPRDAVTCGLYYLTRAAAAKLPDAAAYPRLRDFWSGLVASRAEVAARLFPKTLDVDRPEDLAAAEAYLTQEMTR